MSRAFLTEPLEAVVPFWQVLRRDGVALGFTTHDRDLWFDGLLHRAAPGIAPSAVRLSSGFDGDSAGMAGALSHGGIAETDLAAGRFDGARVVVGAVDCETCEYMSVFSGTIGTVSRSGESFDAQLLPGSARLDRDTVPRTSPGCRAQFCGPGCNLPVAKFESAAVLLESDADRGCARFDSADPERYRFGSLRWLDGPACGLRAQIVGIDDGAFVLDRFPDGQPVGSRAVLREGCDHTLATCVRASATESIFAARRIFRATIC